MKELKFTTKEIVQVEKYLNKKELYYVDLRYEILDHMLLDIEHQMMDEKISFDDAFKNTRNKWGKQLCNSSSFWIGVIFSGPKIFIDKCAKLQKRFFLMNVVTSLLVMSFMLLFTPVLEMELMRIIFYPMTLFCIGSLLYWGYKMIKTKIKSSFAYLFYRQVIPGVFIILLFLLQFINSSVMTLDYSSFYYLVLLFNLFYQGFYLFKNHQKEVSQYHKYKRL
ncbi:MAG: hypothetical protein JKY08_06815 [Flavobacteriaceae bacterium]|nr:hypothetical protein [Flavobacteriaceae bacterium]